MRYRLYIIIIFLFVYGLISCAEREVETVSELQEYVNDTENGLRKVKIRNDLDLEVIYRPKDLVLAQQLDDVYELKEREKVKKQFDSLEYFILHLSRQGHEIENDYTSDQLKRSEILNYFSGGILNDLAIIHNNEVLRPIDIAYIQTFGAGSATSVMVIFKNHKMQRSGDLKFCFHDTMLGTGMHEFLFDTHDIQSIPTLNLD